MGTQGWIEHSALLKEEALNVLFIRMINSKEGTEGNTFFKMQNSEKVWIASSTKHMNINIHALISKAIAGESSWYFQSRMQGHFV